MANNLLKGSTLAEGIKAEVKAQINDFKTRGIEPRLAALLASDQPAVLAYAGAQQKMAEGLGLSLDLMNLDGAVSQSDLENKLTQLSEDKNIHGIILHSPLRPGLDINEAIKCIDPKKDVDGLTAVNLGLTLSGSEAEAILSATPQACLKLIESVTDISGKYVTLVGRGRTVGRPLVPLLLNRHATLTVVHRQTANLAALTRSADILIVAIGSPKFITADYLGEDQIVIDAGINAVGNGLAGDVDFEAALTKAAAVTPVPGGVGTLTTAFIFKNLMKAIKLQGL